MTFLLGPRNAADGKRSPLDEKFLHVQTKTFKHGAGIESSYVDVQSSYRFTLNVPKFD